jgi:hypothetical protein
MIQSLPKAILSTGILLLVGFQFQAQTFTGFSAFKTMMEYEGQRFLMEEVYKVKSEDYDRLKIDKTIQETDSDQGFLFVMTSYKFNEKTGVVFTSFNAANITNTAYKFVNVHLTKSEYEALYSTFRELAKEKPDLDEHILRTFSPRLIADVNNIAGNTNYSLWVDFNNRHTFSVDKWDRAYSRFLKFTE